MGQRLNIEIVAGEKEVCNVYMHWGGCTTLSILYTLDIISVFKNYKFNELKTNANYQELFDLLCKALPRTNLSKNEEEYLQSIGVHLYTPEKADRNEGLISFSKEEMKKLDIMKRLELQ